MAYCNTILSQILRIVTRLNLGPRLTVLVKPNWTKLPDCIRDGLSSPLL